MNCPKCNGEAYLVEEEFVKIIDNTEPMKVVAKAIYQCRSCGERFTRLVIENIDAKKITVQPSRPEGVYSGQTYGSSSRPSPISSGEGESIDQLKFF